MVQKRFFSSMIFFPIILVGCQSTSGHKEMDQTCTDPRPEICTMDYRPVCGYRSDQVPKTYSNGCSACSDTDVIGYQEGQCP